MSNNGTSFGIPPEPRPLSSLDSDEESFVVLGKSLVPENDSNVESPICEPIDKSIVDDAKHLINRELSEMEKSQIDGEEPPIQPYLAICPPKLDENGQPVSPPEINSELPMMPEVDKGFETNNTISIVTLSSDLTSEETQNKIAQIIEENVRLKDTILQNNMSMKLQYERIINWQDEVQKVHQTHKDKILEAKVIIDKLKSENVHLKDEIQEVKTTADSQCDELNKLKFTMKQMEQQMNQKLNETSSSNIKEFELEIANNKIKEMENTVDEAKAQKLILEKAIKARDEQFAKLNDDIKKLTTQLKALDEENAELKKNSLESSLTKSVDSDKDMDDKVAVLAQMIQTITLEKTNLVSEKETLQKSNNDHNRQILELENQVKEAQKIQEKLKTELMESNKRQQALQEELNNINQKQNDGIQTELTTLKLQLKTSKENEEKAKMDLNVALQRQQLLERSVEDLKLQLTGDAQKYHLMQEELTNAKTQLASTQIMLTQVQQSKSEAVAQVERLTRDLDRLSKLAENTQKSQENESSDEFFALKTQLEVYKSDYEAELAAKNAIKEEKNKLLEDIGNLQRRNQQLQEEIEIIRENRDYHVYTPPRRESRQPPTTSSLADLKCPKCNFGFRTVPALENHVYRCIELDEHLP